MKQKIAAIIGLALSAILIYLLYKLAEAILIQFINLDAQIAIGILTASTTVLGATLTVMLGRYFERKKEVESHFRTQKTEIYDEFLQEIFRIFGNPNSEDDVDLVNFLKEWQRKMILWGGSSVLESYITWKKHLNIGTPDAQTIFLMENFFRAMRKDLGLSNRNLTQGFCAHLILREADIFLKMAEKNPNITLAELSEAEAALAKNKELEIR